MPRTKKAAKRTLLMSVIMASPGPIVVGMSLFVGNSSTQMADFIRRTSEFFAIIMSFIVYKIAEMGHIEDELKKEKLQRKSNLVVGVTMLLGGIVMAVLALTAHSTDKGNVIPSLAIALISASSNVIFWRRYVRLNKKSYNHILRVQARLYRAKTLIDTCVASALVTVMIMPTSQFSHILDLGGSAVVAIYLIYSGVRTVIESAKALKTFNIANQEASSVAK